MHSSKAISKKEKPKDYSAMKVGEQIYEHYDESFLSCTRK